MPNIDDIMSWLARLREEHGNVNLALFSPEFGHIDIRTVASMVLHDGNETTILLDTAKRVPR